MIKTDRTPLNMARGQKAKDLASVPVNGGAPGAVAPEPDGEFLHRTAPSRQRFAKAFLQGKAPGIMQRYAPGAKTSDVEGWVEDEETVKRLVDWREYMIQ